MTTYHNTNFIQIRIEFFTHNTTTTARYTHVCAICEYYAGVVFICRQIITFIVIKIITVSSFITGVRQKTNNFVFRSYTSLCDILKWVQGNACIPYHSCIFNNSKQCRTPLKNQQTTCGSVWQFYFLQDFCGKRQLHNTLFPIKYEPLQKFLKKRGAMP